MLYLVTGASGSGKTACLETLRQRNPQVVWYDFDDVGVPADADKVWRQRTTEYWLQRTIQNQALRLDTCINGNIILGEVLACPSAPEINRLAVCLLDCSDVVRIDRLRDRNLHGANMDMLCWAAWQRMHAVDPQWYQNTIREDAAPEMHWERWENWQRGDPRWQTCVLDTTHLTITEVAESILQWMNQKEPC
jgi:AAA domain-containing protein